MSHFKSVYENINKAILDMEIFTSKSDSDLNFVYRYGFMTSNNDEGVVIAHSHALTLKEVEKQIKRLDSIFNLYTTSSYDIEKKEGVFYLTYVVYYPFVSGEGNVGQATLLY